MLQGYEYLRWEVTPWDQQSAFSLAHDEKFMQIPMMGFTRADCYLTVSLAHDFCLCNYIKVIMQRHNDIRKQQGQLTLSSAAEGQQMNSFQI